MTDICIIGSGNVAGALALRIAEIEELHLVGIAARNERQGRSVAQSARCEWSWPEIPAAELYIAAVKDDAIGEVRSLAGIAAGATVVHTSGCVAVDEIGRKNAGVIYPLQSFSAKACTDWNAVPLFIEWTSERARKTVERTASLLSPNVRRLDSAARARLHLAGVMANNFTNLMYAASERIMKDAGLPFGLLMPMIEGSVRKMAAGLSPAEIQSGPAVRGDVSTQGRHLALLHENYPEYEKTYEILSRLIWETLRKT